MASACQSSFRPVKVPTAFQYFQGVKVGEGTDFELQRMERALQRDNREVRELRGLLQMVRGVANLRVRPLRRDNKREQYQTANMQDNED
jgi:hypothetical protein